MEAAADGAFVLGFYYWNPVLEKGIAGLTGKLVLHNSIINEVPGTIEVMEAAADVVFVLGFFYWNPVLEKGIAGLIGKLIMYNKMHTSFVIWRGVFENLIITL